MEMYKEAEILVSGWLQQNIEKTKERKADFLVLKAKCVTFCFLVEMAVGGLVNIYHSNELREGAMRHAP